tara:strand:+ start:238 stop:969 length:732 start_codon:yes stop_codon:yes gene_type:complete
MKKLEGKTALITGAGRGIGKSIAKTFANHGALISVTDVNESTALKTAQEIGGQVMGLGLDVMDSESVQSSIKQSIDHWGHLDILINNAGYLNITSYEDCTEEIWDRTVDINMKGTFLCAQAVVNHMKTRRQGCILNMTSVAAKTGGLASGPAYSASKAGVSAYTIGLAKALAPYSIRVNALSPGVIETDMTSTSAHDPIKAIIPLGKVGNPDDVANAALFLASEDATHITGEILDINGGLFMD